MGGAMAPLCAAPRAAGREIEVAAPAAPPHRTAPVPPPSSVSASASASPLRTASGPLAVVYSWRLVSGPFLLSPSFTSPERTPWGGHRIGVLKAGLVPAGIRIGESWELSAGPELGSRLEDGRLLAEVLAAEPGDVVAVEAIP